MNIKGFLKLNEINKKYNFDIYKLWKFRKGNTDTDIKTLKAISI